MRAQDCGSQKYEVKVRMTGVTSKAPRRGAMARVASAAADTEFGTPGHNSRTTMQRTETCTRLVPWDTCSHMTGCRGVADDTNNATRRAKSHSMLQNLPRWVSLRVLVYDRCTSQRNLLRVAAAISAGEGERSWLLGSRSPQDMQRESGGSERAPLQVQTMM